MKKSSMKVVATGFYMKMIPLHTEPKPKKEYSPELLDAIVEMSKQADTHVEVYPEAPRPGTIVIPTGRLARCRCSCTCQRELPQPEYMIINEDDKRWCLKDDEPKGKRMTRRN